MRFALLLTLILPSCKNAICKTGVDCAGGEVCVAGQSICRKKCTQPIDCTGASVCSKTPSGEYACLNPEEIVRLPQLESNDTTLGNPCFSPKDDGRSESTGSLLACGDNSSLCTQIFGREELSAANDYTCTTECSQDSDCAAEAASACTGDCRAAYNNLCCIPATRVASQEQRSGARKSSTNGQPLSLYCRPRVACYLVPKRCTTDVECGAPNSRAGSKCSLTADGGGACLSGKLAMFECCQRDGECNQDVEHGGANGLSCIEGLDRLSGYCSRPCATDADCREGGTYPNAACWKNTYEIVSDGVCKVRLNPSPVCRNQPMPQIPANPNATVACDFAGDRPITLSDNKYDLASRRCLRTF